MNDYPFLANLSMSPCVQFESKTRIISYKEDETLQSVHVSVSPASIHGVTRKARIDVFGRRRSH